MDFSPLFAGILYAQTLMRPGGFPKELRSTRVSLTLNRLHKLCLCRFIYSRIFYVKETKKTSFF